MFLTRMFLNPARRGTRFLVGSPQAMHAAVLAAFPPGTATEAVEGRSLWRLDQSDNELALLIVSPSAPDLTHVIEQAGWPTAGAWDTIDYSGFLDQVQRGQEYAFRLNANPVKKSRDPEHEGKVLGHVTVRQQSQWLLDRAETNGFEIADGFNGEPHLVVSNRAKKTFKRGDGTVTLSTAQFDGRLRITDPNAARKALSFGIGRAKGYGCGLLTLARV